MLGEKHRLLLKSGIAALHRQKTADDGYVFVAAHNRLHEFTDLVRLESERAGDECMVFPTPAGPGLYNGMYVVPLSQDAPPWRRLKSIWLNTHFGDFAYRHRLSCSSPEDRKRLTQ